MQWWSQWASSAMGSHHQYIVFLLRLYLQYVVSVFWRTTVVQIFFSESERAFIGFFY